MQCRGGSPIIRHNVIHHNGSTGVGAHASWLVTEPLAPPCAHDPTLEQTTFSNGDYRHANVELRPVPLVYDNISFQNNGLGLGNNHYSCAVMRGNEAFWNAVPGEEDEHQSPGIGTRHGRLTPSPPGSSGRAASDPGWLTPASPSRRGPSGPPPSW